MKSKKIVIELVSDDFENFEINDFKDFLSKKVKKYIKDETEVNIAVEIKEDNEMEKDIIDPNFPHAPYPSYPINPCYPPYLYKEGDDPTYPRTPYIVTSESDKSSSDISFSVKNNSK